MNIKDIEQKFSSLKIRPEITKTFLDLNERESDFEEFYECYKGPHKELHEDHFIGSSMPSKEILLGKNLKWVLMTDVNDENTNVYSIFGETVEWDHPEDIKEFTEVRDNFRSRLIDGPADLQFIKDFIVFYRGMTVLDESTAEDVELMLHEIKSRTLFEIDDAQTVMYIEYGLQSVIPIVAYCNGTRGLELLNNLFKGIDEWFAVRAKERARKMFFDRFGRYPE